MSFLRVLRRFIGMNNGMSLNGGLIPHSNSNKNKDLNLLIDKCVSMLRNYFVASDLLRNAANPNGLRVSYPAIPSFVQRLPKKVLIPDIDLKELEEKILAARTELTVNARLLSKAYEDIGYSPDEALRHLKAYLVESGQDTELDLILYG